MAVQTNIFPLYEVEDGVRYTINYKGGQRPVQDYFEVQGRFSHLIAEDFDQIQKMVEEDWSLLLRKAGEQTIDAAMFRKNKDTLGLK
jgi:pyruvate/2-oxoacid:ferredoxin oxidoreductase beta subunit